MRLGSSKKAAALVEEIVGVWGLAASAIAERWRSSTSLLPTGRWARVRTRRSLGPGRRMRVRCDDDPLPLS